MIIVSVDYGDARTGLAVCDKLEMLASPLAVVFEKREERLIEKITRHVSDAKAEMLVVGMPRNMDGSYGFRSQECMDFAKKLGEAAGLEVAMQDERLTTVIAHKALNDVNVRGKKRKDIVDAVSAVIILEDYLQKRKNTI